MCLKIVRFLADTEELVLKLDRFYDIYFTPLQIAVALCSSPSSVRRCMVLLHKKKYLTKYKINKNDRTTALYKMTIQQYNKWYDDDEKFVRKTGNQYGVK